MAKFCASCGTPCADDAAFCTGCGKPLAAPQQPQYQESPAPQYSEQPQAVSKPAPDFKKVLEQVTGFIRQYLKIIIIVAAVFALLVGFLNLGAAYDVSVTTKYGDERETENGSLAALRGSEESMEEVPLYVISTYLIGVAGWVGAALMGFCVYMLIKNIADSRKFFSWGAIIFGAGSLLALLFALFGGTVSESFMGQTVKVIFGVNWTYWVATILGALLVVVDKVLFKDDASPLQ